MSADRTLPGSARLTNLGCDPAPFNGSTGLKLAGLACISHHLTVEVRNRLASTSLCLLAVLNGL